MVKDSRASELVNSFPPTAENYDKAIDSLKSRFGKNELMIEFYIRELLKLVLNNTTKAESKILIASLYDKLETYLRALESLNVITEMCAAMMYPLVESALPEELLRIWQRHSTSLGTSDAKDRLTKVMSFLQSRRKKRRR
ncbi:integrase core domain protein [Lasius niger]|uniref:Integrase core domain protein n=1 Tax=Lasius niger TaxID=67767 RepID=A0A0J7K567_LASNI|nr:integrase core domain protein [Lasius niger]